MSKAKEAVGGESKVSVHSPLPEQSGSDAASDGNQPLAAGEVQNQGGGAERLQSKDDSKEIFNVHIIGDAHYDVFKKKDDREHDAHGYGYDEDGVEVARTYGGVHYVEEVLKKKVQLASQSASDGLQGVNVKRHVDIVKDGGAKDSERLYASKDVLWNIKFYDGGKDKTYRCEDSLEVQWEPSPTKSDVCLLKDFFSINIKENGIVNNFFILEHIGTGNSCDDKGIFEMLDVVKNVISVIYDAITNEAHPKSGKAITKVPRVLWITHRRMPDLLNQRSELYIELSKEAYKGGEKLTTLKMLDEIKRRSIIFIIANTLRKEGAYISRDVSWEGAAQDYMRTYYSDYLMDEVIGYGINKDTLGNFVGGFLSILMH